MNRPKNSHQINDKTAGRCGYIAFYNGRQAEVWANDKYTAVKLSQEYFKPAKSKQHLVTVVLCEIYGEAKPISTATI